MTVQVHPSEVVASEALAQPATPTNGPAVTEALGKLGFTMVDVQDDPRFMVSALAPATGLSGPDGLTKVYGGAFEGRPDKAARRLAAINEAARTAITADEGTVSVVKIPATPDGDENRKALMVAGVDNGRAFVGYAHYGSYKQGKTLKEQVEAATGGNTGSGQKNGVVAHLLPTSSLLRRRRGDRREALDRAKTPAPVGKVALAGTDTIYDRLRSLNPDRVFVAQDEGYTTPGSNYLRDILDSEMVGHNRVLDTARLSGLIGKALGMRPKQAARRFSSDPILWQASVSVADELPPVAELGDHPLDVLLRVANEKITALAAETGRDADDVQAIAITLGAGALGRRRRMRALRQPVSDRLATVHQQQREPEEPVELQAPVKPAAVWGLGKAAAARRLENRTAHQKAVAGYERALRVNQVLIGRWRQYRHDQHEVETSGATMLGRLLAITDRLDNLVPAEGDGGPKVGIHHVVDAIRDPRWLVRLNARRNKPQQDARREYVAERLHGAHERWDKALDYAASGLLKMLPDGDRPPQPSAPAE